MRWLLGVAAALVSMPVIAGSYHTGTGLTLNVRSGDVGTAGDALVFVSLSGAAVGRPACATDIYYAVRDAKSDVGKEQIALFMTAKALGRPLTVAGNGTCVRWPTLEDILAIDWAN